MNPLVFEMISLMKMWLIQVYATNSKHTILEKNHSYDCDVFLSRRPFRHKRMGYVTTRPPAGPIRGEIGGILTRGVTGQNGVRRNGTNKMVAIFIDSNSTELNFYSVTTRHK